MPVPETPPRAVLYLRQSTYREESISLELQETAGRDYCARHGYDVVAVLADPGVSGRTWQRPAVQRAMAMLEGHDADVIVLWRWSRLSRSRRDWALAADRADVAGGRIESATEPNDVTAAGRFARGVMTELAAFESERIGEQWREVQASRVSRGLPPGGKLPWGWVWSPGGPAVVDGDKGEVVAELYRRYLAGAGGRELAAWLNAAGHQPMHRDTWHSATVLTLLDSPVHAGLVTYRGEEHPGAHDGVIDADTLRAYRAERVRRRTGREARRRYLLSGIAHCGACGSPMAGFTITKHARQATPWVGYRCTSLGKDPHPPGAAWSLAARYVEEVVDEWLDLVALDLEAAIGALGGPLPARGRDIERLTRALAGVDAQMVALTGHLVSGLVPAVAYAATRDKLLARRAVLAVELDAAEAAPANHLATPSGRALDTWPRLSTERRRSILHALIRGVDVDIAARTARVVPAWVRPGPDGRPGEDGRRSAVSRAAERLAEANRDLERLAEANRDLERRP